MNNSDRQSTGWSDAVLRYRSGTGLYWIGFFTVVLLLMLHRDWVFRPNSVYLNGSLEGVSQYINTAWHVERDTTLVHFGGQQYPFGEHIAFTDNAALTSTLLQWVHRHILDLSGSTAGILNVLVLVSVLLSAVFMWLLLHRLRLPMVLSVGGALGITFLSPQHAHLQHELGLSVMFVFPMILWLLSVFEVSLTRRYVSLLIGFLVVAATQTNEFFYWLLALFLLGYALWQVFSKPWWRYQYRIALHLMVMVLLPYVLLNFWYHWSDFAVDRPTQLETFRLNKSTFEGLFLPPDFVRQTGQIPQAYLGMTAALFTLLFIVRRFRLFPKHWSENLHHQVHAPFMVAILFSCVLLLLTAIDLSLLPGMGWLWDVTGPLLGLRRPAHLAWGFYYAINIVAVYWFWQAALHLSARYAFWRLPLGLMPIILLLGEACLWQHWIRVSPVPNPTLVSGTPVLERPDDFLAMVSMPYYHATPADTCAQPDADFYLRVRTLGLQYGLPDMGVYQYKPSISKMLQLLQLNLEPCDLPTALNELPEDRPLLLAIDNRNTHQEGPQPWHIWHLSEPLYEDSVLTIRSISPDSIRLSVLYRREVVAKEMRMIGRIKQGEWSEAKGNQPVYNQSYNDFRGHRSFQGGGAVAGNMSERFDLWEGVMDTGTYTISFWMYANKDQGLNHHLHIVVPGEPALEYNLRPYVRAIVNDWALFELPFHNKVPGQAYHCFLYRHDARLGFFLDELLIRRTDQDFYREEPGWMVKNNYWYKEF
jgi:hypothetical protein